jgi:hypothetical protein
MDEEVFEFDLVVTVRKRLWVSGPKTREKCREMLVKCIPEMGCGVFAKRNIVTGHDIETILSNEIELTDPQEN